MKIAILTLVLLILLNGCASNSNQLNVDEGASEPPIGKLSASIEIKEIAEISSDTVNFPKITLENTGDLPIDISFEVSLLKGEEILDKATGVLFMSAIGSNFINEIMPGEKVIGTLNYANSEEIKHNFKLKIDLKNVASSNIIASVTKCLSRSCDDVEEKNLVERESETKTIEITKEGYYPKEININLNDIIEWENKYDKVHYFYLYTCDPDKELEKGITIKTGEKYSKKFYWPGTYKYSCKERSGPFDEGTIIVN
ncbi:MAG: cupredoxin domain-containing protein [Candidatus Nanoarchaeia archaeon]|nr:cupredoxin domain-containing protein [Candidatus Nanoarchaeia archaeon]